MNKGIINKEQSDGIEGIIPSAHQIVPFIGE